ncbi:TIGR02647 family protein [Motiliproteus sediminis]|uniref:TIGR02647 family protein n=1 Tax=Motiliproteus sediminis TaxID=1468178 RepID=UPI001AEF5B6A|nr:TIGR02647 family protein [Motiliproteus sediminis]
MVKRFAAETIAELEFLARYDLDSLQSGIKVHHDAPADVIAASERLFDKGMVSQADGGYLTDRGVEAAQALERALALLGVQD